MEGTQRSADRPASAKQLAAANGAAILADYALALCLVVHREVRATGVVAQNDHRDWIASLIAGKLLHSGRDWNAVLGFHLSNGLIASFRTRSASSVDILGHVVVINSQTASSFGKIGRASCRERVQTAVAGLPSETTDR